MQQPEKEKRKFKRSLCYLKATAHETGDLIGHVGDITHEGLNLVSKRELPLSSNLAIQVEEPESDQTISLIIKGIWNQRNDEPLHFRTGCQILSPSPETIEAINKLIELFHSGSKKRYYAIPPNLGS